MPQLVQAVILPQHGVSVGVQSSSGALKHLALKCQSEMFNCVLPINSHTQHVVLANFYIIERKYVKVILE